MLDVIDIFSNAYYLLQLITFRQNVTVYNASKMHILILWKMLLVSVHHNL